MTLCLLFAVSLLPAVVARYERGTTAGEAAPFVGMGALMLRLFGWARRHRLAVAVTSLVVVAVCGAGIPGCRCAWSRARFSVPVRAGSGAALLDEAFGGAQFVQIWIERADGGDLTDPRALAELRRFSWLCPQPAGRDAGAVDRRATVAGERQHGRDHRPAAAPEPGRAAAVLP